MDKLIKWSLREPIGTLFYECEAVEPPFAIKKCIGFQKLGKSFTIPIYDIFVRIAKSRAKNGFGVAFYRQTIGRKLLK